MENRLHRHYSSFLDIWLAWASTEAKQKVEKKIGETLVLLLGNCLLNTCFQKKSGNFGVRNYSSHHAFLALGGEGPLRTGLYSKWIFWWTCSKMVAAISCLLPVLSVCPVAQFCPLAHEFTWKSITSWARAMGVSEFWPVHRDEGNQTWGHLGSSPWLWIAICHLELGREP